MKSILKQTKVVGFLALSSLGLSGCMLSSCYVPPPPAAGATATALPSGYKEMMFKEISPPCPQCPYLFQKKLETQPGVVSVKIMTQDKAAIVGYDPAKANIPGIVSAARQAQYQTDDPDAKTTSSTASQTGAGGGAGAQQPCTCAQPMAGASRPNPPRIAQQQQQNVYNNQYDDQGQQGNDGYGDGADDGYDGA